MNRFVVRWDGCLLGSYEATDENGALDKCAQDKSAWGKPQATFKDLCASMNTTRDNFKVEKAEV